MTKAVLQAGVVASAMAAVVEPSLHYYLAAHEGADPLYHHLNNWGNLALALVVFLALLQTARLLGRRLLAAAALCSVTVLALNVSLNEFALGGSSFETAPAVFILGVMYAVASVVFSIAFIMCRELMGWLSPALGMTWLLAALANLGVSASLMLGSPGAFWWALNGGVSLSVVAHVLFCVLFMTVLKTLR